MESIINAQVPEFKVQAFQNGNFKTVSNEDIKGKWAIFCRKSIAKLRVRSISAATPPVRSISFNR